MTDDEIIAALEGKMEANEAAAKRNPSPVSWNGGVVYGLRFAIETIKGERLAEQVKPEPCLAIMALARDMQHKLDKNERKPCRHMQLEEGAARTWEHCRIDWLITRIEDEVEELREELGKGNIAEARLECADISNFAMMIHDNLGRETERKQPAPDLPPLPEKDLVVLPAGFVKPEGVKFFDAWVLGCISDHWERNKMCLGPTGARINRHYRYAVPASSEIARINGVGWGECPSRWGWHVPEGLTPQGVGVPDKRPLARDEVGMRRYVCSDIEQWNFHLGAWTSGSYGMGCDAIYRTAAPYGSLPPVTEHTFPECAPPKPDKGYGQDLDGNPVPDVDDRHEIIPEGTRVHEGEVTHYYADCQWYRMLGEYPSAGRVTEVHGRIRAYARLRYSVLHERSGIKPGDVVEVTQAAERDERGWDNSWSEYQEAYVGKRGTVVADCGNEGFLVERNGERWWFPAFVLRKVERRKVPLEASDWAGGPWTVVDERNTPNLRELVESVDWETGQIETCSDRYSDEELKKQCKRARGWPGDDLAFEPCWKWADEE